MRRTFLLGLALLASWSHVAHAAPKDEARRHFNTALELIAAGNYDAGIAEFKVAYEIVPHPVVLYNIARAYADAKDYEHAIEYFELYLATEPIDRTEVQDAINTLRSRMGTQTPVQPEVQSDVIRGGTATADELTELRRHAAELSALAERLAEREADAIAARDNPPPVVQTPPEKDPSAPVLGGGAMVEDLYERVVVTASRFGQDPLDSPASVTLITQDDIAMSAATSIPELLKLVPGIDVMQLTGSSSEVSIRGFNRRLSNKVLVLIDGRNVYLDFIGANLWAALPVSIEEIDRIEIIRGPGSAIYGANAFAGVINIITRTPGDPSQSNQISLHGGTGDYGRGNLVASGRKNHVGWRTGASYYQVGRWSQEVDLDTRDDVSSNAPNQDISARVVSANAQFDWQLNAKSFASVSGGFSNGPTEFYSLGALRSFWFDQTNGYVRGDVGYGPVHLRSFYNGVQGYAENWYYETGGVSQGADIESNVWDTELQGDFPLGESGQHILTAGLGYRYKDIDWAFLSKPAAEHHVNGFIQEQSSFGPITVAGAFRVDRHPLEQIGVKPSGRLSVVAHVDEGRAVRVNAGNAFRIPTFLESYTDLYLPTGVDGVLVNSVGSARTIDAEGIIAAEVGYVDQSSDSWRGEASVYGYQVRNLIDLGNLVPDTRTDGVGDSGTYVAGTAAFINEDSVFWAYGGELAGSYFGLPGLDLSANYAFEQIFEDSPDADAWQRYRAAPQHKLNGSVAWRTPWTVDLGMQVSYVSAQTWPLRSYNSSGQVVISDGPLGAYTVLSNKVVWHPLGRTDLDLSVSAWNWLASLNGPHREEPVGQPVGARYFGSMAYRF